MTEPVAPETAAPSRRSLRALDLARISSRALYLQALFSAERQQGPGFAFALVPAARRLYASAEERGKLLARHLGFFGTHPVLAGYVLGVVARLEERRALGEDLPPERIEQVKRALASPLAALGDPLFWVTLRPLAGLAGILGMAFLPLTGPEEPDLRVLLCPLLALLTYNAVALGHRLAGVHRGYALADEPGRLLRSLHLAEWKQVLERMSAFAFGALAALTLAVLRPSLGLGGMKAGQVALALMPLLAAAVGTALSLRRWPGRGVEIALGASGLALALSVRL